MGYRPLLPISLRIGGSLGKLENVFRQSTLVPSMCGIYLEHGISKSGRPDYSSIDMLPTSIFYFIGRIVKLSKKPPLQVRRDGLFLTPN